jgi:hypothetical protein
METNQVLKRHGRQVAVAWFESLSLEDKYTYTVIVFGPKVSYKKLTDAQKHEIYKYNSEL